ncbi:MAG: hypothetical protein GY861_13115 [bacterium]|nr:hypothetical protein [bacterium]
MTKIEYATTCPHHHSNKDNTPVEVVQLTEDEWEYIMDKVENGGEVNEALLAAAKKHAEFEQAISIDNVTGV